MKNSSTVNNPSAQSVQDVPIVGIFRSRARVDDAVEALKEANFGEDQIDVTEYQGAHTENYRLIVQVRASGRDHEAVGILVHHGANNSDLLPGTAMVRGNLVLRDREAVSTPSQQPTQVDPGALPHNL